MTTTDHPTRTLLETDRERLNDAGFVLMDMPELLSSSLSFSNLPADPYCSNRTRRFSAYRLTHSDEGWGLERLPSRPLIQPKQNNAYIGGVLRILAPMDLDPSAYVTAVASRLLPLDDEWHVDVHQWRTHCSADSAGISVPEGPHQDGHDYAAILVVARHGVIGGLTTLYSLEGQPFFECTLQPGEALLLNDRRMMHYTSDIDAADKTGHRDIFVFTFSRWANRRYGPDFEESAVG